MAFSFSAGMLVKPNSLIRRSDHDFLFWVNASASITIGKMSCTNQKEMIHAAPHNGLNSWGWVNESVNY